MEKTYLDHIFVHLEEDDKKLIEILFRGGCVERFEVRNLMYKIRKDADKELSEKDYGNYVDMLISKLETVDLVKKGNSTESGQFVALTEKGYELTSIYLVPGRTTATP